MYGCESHTTGEWTRVRNTEIEMEEEIELEMHLLMSSKDEQIQMNLDHGVYVTKSRPAPIEVDDGFEWAEEDDE
jgi:hypothetical protein